MADLTSKQDGLRAALEKMENQYRNEKEEYLRKAADDENVQISDLRNIIEQ